MRSASLPLVIVLALALATPSFAQKDKDDNHGHGQGGTPGKGASQSRGVQGPVTISDRDRNTVYSYYRTEYNQGRCPPGLAKKGNGCLPPGQAKKMWVIGQPLPTGVAYEALPSALLRQLSPAPAGYQYVRVANDVLMMAAGTRLIAGALADLGSF